MVTIVFILHYYNFLHLVQFTIIIFFKELLDRRVRYYLRLYENHIELSQSITIVFLVLVPGDVTMSLIFHHRIFKVSHFLKKAGTMHIVVMTFSRHLTRWRHWRHEDTTLIRKAIQWGKAACAIFWRHLVQPITQDCQKISETDSPE